MGFSALFILRPVATILLAFGLFLSGAVAYWFLPVAALPKVDMPTIVVFAGRPGADPENVAPATVEAALYECARAVMIAPPKAGEGGFNSVVVAWNGSFQAARSLEYSLPFLTKASKVTLLVVGSKPDDVGASYLQRNLGRHGINVAIDAIDPGAVSARARGRDLLNYTHEKGADLLVMGAYGRGQVLSFLGLGGATAKVISSCRVPLLLAH